MFPVGTPVIISKDCDLWGGCSGVVYTHRTPPYIVEDAYIGVKVATDHGPDDSWFREGELEESTDNAFLRFELLTSVEDLIRAEVSQCDHDDDSTLRWVEFIDDDGRGENHRVCKFCDGVVCCPEVDVRYRRAVR